MTVIDRRDDPRLRSARVTTRRAALLIVAYISAWVLAAGTSATRVVAASGARCSTHRHANLLVTARVIVYTRRWAAGAADNVTAVLACKKPAGRSVLLGLTLPDDGEYGSDATLDGVRAAGTLIAAHTTHGAANASACSKYTSGPCPSVRHKIVVVDVRTRRRVVLATHALASPLILSSRGILAWLQVADTPNASPVLRAASIASTSDCATMTVQTRELDQGPIDPASVRIVDRAVQWRHADTPMSAVIEPTPTCVSAGTTG